MSTAFPQVATAKVACENYVNDRPYEMEPIESLLGGLRTAKDDANHRGLDLDAGLEYALKQSPEGCQSVDFKLDRLIRLLEMMTAKRSIIRMNDITFLNLFFTAWVRYVASTS